MVHWNLNLGYLFHDKLYFSVQEKSYFQLSIFQKCFNLLKY